MVNETCSFRIEEDSLGKLKLDKDCLWGISTQRALENFSISPYKQHPEFLKAMAMVKLACAETNNKLGFLENEYFDVIHDVCQEIIDFKHNDLFVIDAFQGGAGTSVNMNFNEVIANLSNIKLGKKAGDYFPIEPIKHINMHQSTNDVYPSALKVAILFFAYSEALSRDRWRIFKCRERIKTINLGATAIGTGLGAPRKYIFQVTQNLKRICGLNVSRAENLVDATQNLDSFCEISGMLKTYAANIYKISNDLRLMGSGPNNGFGEIQLPANQAGSSIMPSKVNPVICESVSQVALKVMNNDALITQITKLTKISDEKLQSILSPQRMYKLGYDNEKDKLE